MADLQLSDARASLQVSLNPRRQFWWGFFGGALIPFFQAGMFAHGWASGAAGPGAAFPTCLVCVVWIALPFASGGLTRALNPQTRLHAIFEGITAPAVFVLLAQHFHL
jgi:hypothetical protein